jgi:hypothetical protein
MKKTKKKVFLCSTSFDLEDFRALIVDRFGNKYDFIHFEDAAFPSRRGLHSHDQCIEAVKLADIVVCIIDKRYGSCYAGSRADLFPDQHIAVKSSSVTVPTNELSISWCELIAAYRDQKYVMTFARRRAFDEKATRRKNHKVIDFKPAHVENARIFDLLDWITKQPRDNWIIPFNNAVDFLASLDKWLAVAEEAIVPSSAPEEHSLKPITLIVEGQTDATIVKAIVSSMNLQHPVSITVAEGKRALLGNLKVYAEAFRGGAGLLVLADADTEDIRQIEIQKRQFDEIMRQTSQPNARLVLAVPEIEIWLGRTPFKRGRIDHFNKLFEELHFLQKNLTQRASQIPSLGEFVNYLKDFDEHP